MPYTTTKEEEVFTEEEVAAMLGITVADIHSKTENAINDNCGDIDYVLCSFGELGTNSKEKYLQDTNTNPKQREAEHSPFSIDEDYCLWKKEGVLWLCRYFDTVECLDLYITLIDNYLSMRKYGYNPELKETENVTHIPANELYVAVLK